jgi:hypothetical protein
MKIHGIGSIDREEVERALPVLLDPELGHEVTTLPTRDRDARICHVDSMEVIISHIETIHNREPRGVYWVINPVTQERCVEVAKPGHPRPSTKDAHVQRRRWLYVDFDPVRPRDTNSTEQEHDQAQAVAQMCREYLGELGWPEPVQMDSGNGYALLYRIDLPNDEASRELIKGCLHALAQRFTDEKVEIDKSVYNAARLARLPGTINRKGPHTPDRPRRRCRLTVLPEALAVVDADQLAMLATLAAEQTAKESKAKGGITLRVTGSAAKAYVEQAIKAETLSVLRASPGQRNNTLNRAAYALFTLAGGGHIDADRVETELASAARAIGLGEGEIRATLASAREAGMARPRGELPTGNTPKAGQRKVTDQVGGDAGESKRWQLHDDDGRLIASGDALDWPEYARPQGQREYRLTKSGTIARTDYPPPKWVVEGLLTEGLSILAGGPKLGKSMLALNLALTIAGGGRALGGRSVQPGDVLYLALEDVDRRIKSRQAKMLDALPLEVRQQAAQRLDLMTRWRRQDEGGLAMIDAWLKDRPSPVLVIIDVWNRYQPNKEDRNAYRSDADAMAALKALADHHQVAVLVVHHTRKSSVLSGGDSEDFVEEVSGTLGLAGTADTTIGLLRVRGESGALLKYTGRDIDTGEIAVDFDAQTLTWKAQDATPPTLEARILEHLRRCGDDGATAPDVAAAIRHGTTSVRVRLNRMLADQLVGRRGNSWFLVRSDPTSETL